MFSVVVCLLVLPSKLIWKLPPVQPRTLKTAWIAGERAVDGVGYLAFAEVHFTFVAVVGESQGAALASHFQRLHQVDHVHLRQAAAQHAVGGRGLGHFFQRDLVDHALDALGGFFQEKRFFDEIIDRFLVGKSFR